MLHKSNFKNCVMKAVNIIIKLVLLGIIVFLIYLIVAGIQKPIDFDIERKARFNKVIERLKDIRTAQVEYKNQYGYYTPDFDTLINFIKNAKMPVVYAEGAVPDSLTELEAFELGIIKRDTSYVPYMDTLFKHIDYKIERMKYIPVGTKAQFRMDTATINTGSGVPVKVFEARISNWDVLHGLDEQLIINYNSENDSVIKVGSLETANNNAGNWE